MKLVLYVFKPSGIQKYVILIINLFIHIYNIVSLFILFHPDTIYLGKFKYIYNLEMDDNLYDDFEPTIQIEGIFPGCYII